MNLIQKNPFQTKNLVLIPVLILFILYGFQASSQSISINNTGDTPDGSAMLDIQSDSKGILIPRMNAGQRTGINPIAPGLLVYDTDSNSFWYHNGSVWVELVSSGGTTFLTDADGDTKVQVEENGDDDVIRFDVGGDEAMVLNSVGELLVKGNNPNAPGYLQLSNIDSSQFVRLFSGKSSDQQPFFAWELGSPMRFVGMNKGYSGFTEHMRIQGDGNVGIGESLPLSKLHVAGGFLYEGAVGSIPIEGAGVRMMWVPEKRALRVGEVHGLQWNLDSIGDYSTVTGGVNNVAKRDFAIIGGGADNRAFGFASHIGGGYKNYASGQDASIGGGSENSALGRRTFVGGGLLNMASNDHSLVVGGQENIASGNHSNVGGGFKNEANGDTSAIAGGSRNTSNGGNSFIGGGKDNKADGGIATIGGGIGNQAIGTYSVVGGGLRNKANSDYASSVGGADNTSSGVYSFVGGGYLNIALEGHSFVGGGFRNSANVNYSTVVGGYDNEANASYSVLVGGSDNIAGGISSFLGGGYLNNANGQYSVVAGGQFNEAYGVNSTIGGGYNNTSNGDQSTVAGGSFNTTTGNYSFVGGGLSNSATGHYALVGSGSDNIAGEYSAVLGGEGNEANAAYGYIGGGLNNKANNLLAVVVGGDQNEANADYSSVGGGKLNKTLGAYSRVAGGRDNYAYGDYSFVAGGINNIAQSYGEIVLGYNSTIRPLASQIQSPILPFPSDRLLVIGNGALPETPSNALTILKNGNMGIGEDDPTAAKLVVNGTAGLQSISAYYYSSSGPFPFTSFAPLGLSAYFSNAVAADGFFAFSDARIKKNIRISDARNDLKTIMNIEITDYNLIDTFTKGNKPYKKVIAQQVKEVFPQAVSSNLTDVIPDIYQRAEINNGWISLETDLKVGERVKLITDYVAEVYEVTKVSLSGFQVNDLPIDSDKVFVYGREVDDFHTVDYEAISMLNVSATQAQQKLIEDNKTEIMELKEMVKAQDMQLRELKKMMNAIYTERSVSVALTQEK